MKPTGRPILAAFKRAYAAQAKSAKQADRVNLLKQEPQVSKLPNGLIIASVENNSPVAQVAVLCNAGSRYEPESQLGITHCIRNSFCLSNEKTTQFGLTRAVQQIGGNASCQSTREHMIYSLYCNRDEIDQGVKLITQATKPSFFTWELQQAKQRLKLDYSLFQQDPQARLMEALHKAAYRGGLEHSLYCEEHKLGWHSPDMLQAYVSKHYTASNMALVGLGISHDRLTIHAREMGLAEGPAPKATPAKYAGEQVRIDANGDLVFAAVVTEGFGLGSADLLKLCVLQQAMGSSPYVKYGSNLAASKVNQAAAKATKSPFAASCIMASYSDTGLFGFNVITQASDAADVLKSVAAAFGEATKGSITDADVQRAKNQLKAATLMEMESSSNLLLEIGQQALTSGQVLSMDNLLAAVDQITTADVQNIAKKVINGKPSMAAIGNLSNTPYLDQIF